jgi:hypothetical protein
VVPFGRQWPVRCCRAGHGALDLIDREGVRMDIEPPTQDLRNVNQRVHAWVCGSVRLLNQHPLRSAISD